LIICRKTLGRNCAWVTRQKIQLAIHLPNQGVYQAHTEGITAGENDGPIRGPIRGPIHRLVLNREREFSLTGGPEAMRNLPDAMREDVCLELFAISPPGFCAQAMA
jgi:hypothetical protein